jgi:NtrC-family two-component system response regulator AlgB
MTAVDSSAVPLHVVVIDDAPNIRATLSVCLEGMGCAVTAVGTADAAQSALRERAYDLAFLDLRLGSDSGLELLPKLLALRPELAVVVITAYAAFDTAVEAVRRGAFDYLPKPFTPDQIRLRVEQVARRRALTRRVSELEDQLRETAPAVDLDTASPRMRNVLDTLARAAPSAAVVLLRGESGTGKTILARAVHVQSPRADGPFVVVNCPTLSTELLASELFGHARGAFTGAVRDRIGRVEAAHGGTLFLDEIAEIPPDVQAKLLRFLQDRCFERVGENQTRRADVRVVAATNRDLEAEVRAGRFREDLLYRLNVIEVTIPPLRERPEDVIRLANEFLAFFARTARRTPPTLSPAAERALLAYSWPGNVRELRNAMERATILSTGDVLEPEAFAGRITPDGGPAPRIGGPFTLEEIEREHVQRVVASSATLDEAARVLGIEPSTLWRKRKRYEP